MLLRQLVKRLIKALTALLRAVFVISQVCFTPASSMVESVESE